MPGTVESVERSVKKGRHRRYEEARALKRGPDLDIESILDDLSSDGPARSSGDPDDFDVLEADDRGADPGADLDEDHDDDDRPSGAVEEPEDD